MPPTRRPRRTGIHVDPVVLDALSVQELRELCRQNNVQATGSRNTLVRRLRDHGVTRTAPETDEGINPINDPTPPAPRGPDPAFSPEQMTALKELIQATVVEASGSIASEAAKAAVEALTASGTQVQSSTTSAPIPDTPSTPFPQATSLPLTAPHSLNSLAGSITTSSNTDGSGFEIPGSYIKEIESGEIFD